MGITLYVDIHNRTNGRKHSMVSLRFFCHVLGLPPATHEYIARDILQVGEYTMHYRLVEWHLTINCVSSDLKDAYDARALRMMHAEKLLGKH